MIVTPFAELPEVLLIRPRQFTDARGHFHESYSRLRYSETGIVDALVQDNVSVSSRGVLRGLHYQWPNHAQGKLVSVAHGSVWDVAVDIRRDSQTFGKWVAAEISAESATQLWIPRGFAHGFLALSEGAVFTYKCSDYYSPADERSIAWNDPQLAIPWPIHTPILSPKDAAAPLLSEIAIECLPTS